MSAPISIAVNGAAGRMGQRIVALTHADAELKLGAALEAAGNPAIGRDAGELAGVGPIGVSIAAELVDRVDVVIDFSMPDGLVRIAEVCAERQIPLVGATTGLTAAQKAAVLSAAQQTPLILAPSMSLAVNLAMKLVGDAAAALKSLSSGVDVEIVERHHRFKEDARAGRRSSSARSSRPKWDSLNMFADGKAVQASGRSRRSGITPSAPATTSASMRSSSGCWARRCRATSAGIHGTVTPTGRWRQRSIW